MNYLVFFLVILLSNIIQGITGFAGTILAMPPSLILVGYHVAKPVLNILGIYSGLYVFVTNKKYIVKKELKKVLLFMVVGILGGFFIKSLFIGKEEILYKCLGIFVMILAVFGLYSGFGKKKEENKEQTGKKEEDKEREENDKKKMKIDMSREGLKGYLLLLSSGIVHGMFVCGGPLLIAYMSKTIKDKRNFRATISTVWIVLNSIILLDDIHAGLWTVELVKMQVITAPLLFLGMAIGTKLYQCMSQEVFMKLTYILLFISGISLL